MKKTLALGLMMLVGSQVGMAQAQEQECATPALMSESQAMQSRVEAYVNANSEQPGQAMQQLQQAMTNAGVEETLSEHTAELEQMEPGSDHQPSQALCDDMYAMFDRVDDELADLE